MTNQKYMYIVYSTENRRKQKTFGMFIQPTVDGQRSMHYILNRSIVTNKSF